jgi:hypothetical protein
MTALFSHIALCRLLLHVGFHTLQAQPSGPQCPRDAGAQPRPPRMRRLSQPPGSTEAILDPGLLSGYCSSGCATVFSNFVITARAFFSVEAVGRLFTTVGYADPNLCCVGDLGRSTSVLSRPNRRAKNLLTVITAGVGYVLDHVRSRGERGGSLIASHVPFWSCLARSPNG